MYDGSKVTMRKPSPWTGTERRGEEKPQLDADGVVAGPLAMDHLRKKQPAPVFTHCNCAFAKIQFSKSAGLTEAKIKKNPRVFRLHAHLQSIYGAHNGCDFFVSLPRFS